MSLRLGIDASNLRSGGGVTHLVEVLRHATPERHGFNSVAVWGPRSTLDRLEDRPWLERSALPVLESNVFRRALWQGFALSGLAKDARCDLLFVPGGSFATSFRPVVTMSQNMLPFEPDEARRYGLSRMRLRILLLRHVQMRAMRRADGCIFLTRYAQSVIQEQLGQIDTPMNVIPHGIHARFRLPARPARPLAEYTPQDPFRLLYVSIIDVYKHQDRLAEAVATLRARGVPVTLDMVGSAYPPALARLRATLNRLDPEARFLRYLGPIPYERLHEQYAQADGAVFASSCENMPNILLEMMAAALPIACARRGPMPEVLGDAGCYFDPESVSDIVQALTRLLGDVSWRRVASERAASAAAGYTWERCADETFAFLARVVGSTVPRSR